jgi:hypothetical protein
MSSGSGLMRSLRLQEGPLAAQRIPKSVRAGRLQVPIQILIRVAVQPAGLYAGSKKYPDAHLIDLSITYPLVVLEVGFSQSLESLFKVAEAYFHGCDNAVQLVILVKIHQDRAATPVAADYPWGLSDDVVKMKPSAVIEPVVSWYRQRNRPLVRPMTASVYLYSREMSTRPRRPIWTYKFADEPLHERVKTKYITRGSFLSEDLNLKILGVEMPFPWSRLEKRLHEAIRTQEKLRALQLVIDTKQARAANSE